jgi:rhamnose utilization protein RhaD (predicted bifunctional aldolase and dehydrogenase)
MKDLNPRPHVRNHTCMHAYIDTHTHTHTHTCMNTFKENKRKTRDTVYGKYIAFFDYFKMHILFFKKTSFRSSHKP